MCGWYYDIVEEMEEEERIMNIENTIKEFSGKGFSHFKPILVELAVECLSPISSEMRLLLKDTKEIDKIFNTDWIYVCHINSINNNNYRTLSINNKNIVVIIFRKVGSKSYFIFNR